MTMLRTHYGRAMFGGKPGGARREYRAPEPKHLIRLTFLRLGDVFALAMGAMNRFHKPASSVTMMFSIEYHRAFHSFTKRIDVQYICYNMGLEGVRS